jgi:hypothetical protein
MQQPGVAVLAVFCGTQVGNLRQTVSARGRNMHVCTAKMAEMGADLHK